MTISNYVSLILIAIAVCITICNLWISSRNNYYNRIAEFSPFRFPDYPKTNLMTYPILFKGDQDIFAELKNWLISEHWEFEQISHAAHIFHTFKKVEFTITDHLNGNNPNLSITVAYKSKFEAQSINPNLSIDKQIKTVTTFMEIYNNDTN